MSTDRNILTPHQQMKNSLLDWDMSTDRNIGNGQVPLCASLLDWDMSTDRNGIPLVYGDAYSLLDWDMSTDRNVFRPVMVATSSLLDWDMSTDRNISNLMFFLVRSLLDWDMSTDRNREGTLHLLPEVYSIGIWVLTGTSDRINASKVKFTRLGYEYWPEHDHCSSLQFRSLLDWDMSTDRNDKGANNRDPQSLLDWDMSTDNIQKHIKSEIHSAWWSAKTNLTVQGAHTTLMSNIRHWFLNFYMLCAKQWFTPNRVPSASFGGVGVRWGQTIAIFNNPH